MALHIEGHKFVDDSFSIGAHVKKLWTHKVARFTTWEYQNFELGVSKKFKSFQCSPHNKVQSQSIL